MTSPSSSERTLIQGLGLSHATTIVVGGIIGVSIFLVTSDVAREVQAPGMVLLTWVVSGVLATCAALCFAELSAAIPETGGTYVFLKRAYPGTGAGFFFGWMMFFCYATGAVAVVASMAAIYGGQILGRFLPYGLWTQRGFAVGLIVLLTLINYLGVRHGGSVQAFLTVLKVGMMVVLIATGAVALTSETSSATQVFVPFAPEERQTSELFSSLGAAMLLTLFSYSGAYFVTHVAGEVRDAQRNVPRAIVLGMAVVVILYLMINVAYLATLPFEQVQGSERVASDMMEAVLGSSGADIVALAVMLSAIGTLNAQLLNYPRIVFAMASDGVFFRVVGKVDPVRRTPSVAILMIGGWACILALSGTYQQILSYAGFVSHFFISLAVAAVIVLRIREPELERPYRVWGYPFTPILFLLVSAWYLGNLLLTRTVPTLLGVLIVLAGLPFLLYWRRRARTAP